MYFSRQGQQKQLGDLQKDKEGGSGPSDHKKKIHKKNPVPPIVYSTANSYQEDSVLVGGSHGNAGTVIPVGEQLVVVPRRKQEVVRIHTKENFRPRPWEFTVLF